MSFLDQKEEVIEIQLTQYGKHLLSRGKFSPKMYAFFDDDVVYDFRYAAGNPEEYDVNYDERGIDAQNRIEEESVRLKTQYVFSSREKEVKRLTAALVSGKADLQDRIIQPTADRHYALSAPLGNSSLGVNKAPSWKINFLKGETAERVEHLTGALPTLKIPQLQLKPIMYKTRVWFDIPPDNSFSAVGGRVGDAYGAGSQGDLSVTLEQYEDGSYVSVQEDYALIDVREMNSDFLNENFDIEVFLVEDVDFQNNIVPPSMKDEVETREKLYPLSFIQQKKFIKDGFLLDTPEGGPADENPVIDPSYVEYWFNIWVDDEIDERVIKLSEVEPGENIYMAKDSDRARGRGTGRNALTGAGAPSSEQIVYGSRGYTSGGSSGYGVIIEDDGECDDE
jgi:hypothetical protein